MQRYIAFLRAINVGGHVVKMDVLRAHFEALRFSHVTTFIASGNVIFDARENAATLETKIESTLQRSLGYDVATFLRTPVELAAIAACEPFAARQLTGNSLYVVFLKRRLERPVENEVMTFRGAVDDFRVHEREVYWLLRGKFVDSQFSAARLEKLSGMPVTVRNITTVNRLAAKYPPG